MSEAFLTSSHKELPYEGLASVPEGPLISYENLKSLVPPLHY